MFHNLPLEKFIFLFYSSKMTVERILAKKGNGHNGNGCKTENNRFIPKDIYRNNKRRMPKHPQREKKKQSST